MEETDQTKMQATAEYDFNAENEGELSVKEGQSLIVMVRECSEGWTRVKTLEGSMGVVPSSFLSFLPSKTEKTITTVEKREESVPQIASISAPTVSKPPEHNPPPSTSNPQIRTIDLSSHEKKDKKKGKNYVPLLFL